MKHFTILEIGTDAESPMVGTILNASEDIEALKLRVMTTLEEYFDSDDIHWKQDFPDVFKNVAYEDIKIDVNGNNFEIRIIETWMY